MITINPAILSSQFGNYYLPKVRDYCQLDGSVCVQGSVSLAVDVARHVKSTTPSTFVWSKKTSLTVLGAVGCSNTRLRVFFLFVCFVGTTDVSECCMSSAKRHVQLSVGRTPLGTALCRSS